MKKVLVVCACGMLAATLAAAETILSPDGQVAVTVSVENGLAWQVQRKGKEVLMPSRLGLAFKGKKPFGAFEVVNKAERTIDETWTNRLYKKEVILDYANELTLELREKAAPNRRLDLVFRAYDGAVAFRYGIPEQPGFELFTVTQEQKGVPLQSVFWHQAHSAEA